MFEGADLVLTGDDQQPASPRSGSSSPSSASASPAGSLIGGMVGHDDAPATTMVGPFVVASSSSSQSVAVRPLLSSGSLIVSGSHAVLPNTVSSRNPTETADAVLCDLQSSSSTSRSRKDRRAPVLLEKRSLDVEMERIEASSSHDDIEPVPDHTAAASAEPRQPLSRGGSGIVPAAGGHSRLRGNTLEPGATAGAAALPSPSSADGASPRGTTAASDLVSPRRATLSTATAVPPLRPSSGTLSADNGPTPSPGSGGSSSAARSPRRTFSCHPSPAPSDPAAAASTAAGPSPSTAATPSPGSGGPSSSATAGRGRAPPPPSTASKPRFTMASGGGGGKPPVVGTTNPLPLAAFGHTVEPAPSPSSSSPPPSGGSSSTSDSPSSLSPSSSTLSPAAAVVSPGDAGFRSRVSYYTPNPITDDASTTTSRATRPRGGPRGRGRD